MNKFLILIIISTISLGFAENQEWPQIYDSHSKNWVSWSQLRENMATSEIVYVGELHNHVWGHKVEYMLLEELFAAKTNVAVAFEMFERDVQNIMDGYLKGQVDKDFFLANTRPWGNYETDYSPLVEFARIYRLPALAMNVPRRYASFVAKDKEEALKTMPETEKNFMAPEIKAPQGKYRDKFYKTMEGHVPPQVIERYYRSQCLKDDTMAESMVSFLKENPHTTIISYMGAFHCEESLGVPEKVNLLTTETKTLTITIIPVDGEKANPEKHIHKGDFLIFAPANENESSLSDQIRTKLID